MFKKSNSLLLVFLFTFVLTGCATIYNPATEKKEIIFIARDSEVSLGRNMDKQIKGRLKVSPDPAANSRLNCIGQKVAANSHRTDIAYHFNIIKDDELNAFAIPGGYIYVNSGLMKFATDDELACVLGHEIGHIAARHSVKKIQAELGYQIIMSIALGLSGAKNIGRAVDIAFDVVGLGYSRADENLADKLSVRYAKRAGFNPNATVTFLEKLKKEVEKKGPNFNLVFLSSHPPLDERIKNVKNEIVKLQQ